MSLNALTSEELLLDQYKYLIEGFKKKLQELSYYAEYYDISLRTVDAAYGNLTQLQREMEEQTRILQEKGATS